ncbi:MAG: stage II sporulation protein M [Bifidobacteriaceae bacterium]|jgi:uncharacterized membrane protein SpoIIM required for sporulation|nr:stage II sporulation protein M [Bifidobacteriaceae bacterium]
MDIEAFTTERAQAWERVSNLSGQRRLTGAEADELVWLYERGATDLSQLRSEAPDPQLVSGLSAKLGAARARILGVRRVPPGTVRRFFEFTMPRALYGQRWWLLGVSLVVIVTAVIAGVWVNQHPAALAIMGTPEALEEYTGSSFANYYSEYAHSSFAAHVWTNNARLAALCVAGGVTGIVPAYVMLSTAVDVGAAGGAMWAYGRGGMFFELITPHGLLELTCVFAAGAVGLKLFWAWIAPGGRTRARALANEGRAAATNVVALSLALGLSGLIEGFVTPSSMPSAVKIAIGALAFAAFCVYMLVAGRRADRLGAAGLDEA